MTKFRYHTLARLLVSFIPMIDFMTKNRIVPKRIGSFGSGSCSHEVFLALIFPHASVSCFDQSRKYVPVFNDDAIKASSLMSFAEVSFEDFNWETTRDAFDFVFSIQALEHVSDPDAALASLAKSVRNSGYLYVDTPFYSEVPRLDDPAYLEAERLRQWNKDGHHHLGFSLSAMARRFAAHDLEVVSSGYSSHRRGDNQLLRYLRCEETRLGVVTEETALAMCLMFCDMLRNFEASLARSGRDPENQSHKEREVYAIRLLGRRCRDSSS
ncbi:MAG: methyltransferase domain-containing protein [Microcella sp.]|uniref:methyltransferase domain-containing protein n=1 Tax=Microcella sp. TaxID=1913979 RepID=UPI003314593B